VVGSHQYEVGVLGDPLENQPVHTPGRLEEKVEDPLARFVRDFNELGVFQLFSQGPGKIGGMGEGLKFRSGQEDERFLRKQGEDQMVGLAIGVIKGEMDDVRGSLGDMRETGGQYERAEFPRDEVGEKGRQWRSLGTFREQCKANGVLFSISILGTVSDGFLV